MKILQVANFVSPKSGGLRTAIDALRSGYEDLGWSVYRITPFPDAGCPLDVVGIQSFRVPTMHSYRVILQRRRIQEIILDMAPDVIELSDKSTLSWLPFWAKKNGIPCCVISHERMDLVLHHARIAGLPLRWLSQKWRRDIADNASRVICASQFAAVEFEEFGIPIDLIPLGITLDAITPMSSRDIKDSTVEIVMCTRLSEEKKPHVGIEAVRLFSQQRKVHLTVMGDGPSRARLEDLAVGLDVDFLGHIADRQEVLYRLGSADIVLNLGPLETFGLVTLEALATGTPVIVANTGASWELIDLDCGRAVDTNAESVVQGIEEVVKFSNSHTWEKCRLRASQFSWSTTVAKFAEMYMDVAKVPVNAR
jgi:alpha-1,6-mannosyltransferase